jgi:hypothetical protein
MCSLLRTVLVMKTRNGWYFFIGAFERPVGVRLR